MTTGEVKVVLVGVFMAMSIGLIQGCSSDRASRLVYEMVQTRQQLECQGTPGQHCPERQSYDSYQQQKNE